MSYGEKFSLSFTDVRGNNRKLSILKKNYTGSVLPLVGTGDPVVIKWDSNDDVFTPIIGSTCELNLYVTSSTNYDDWYDADEREYKVTISTGSSIGAKKWELQEDTFAEANFLWNEGEEGFESYWEGFLVVDRYQEAFQSTPYPIKLIASDGLGTLDGFDAPLSNFIPVSGESNPDPSVIQSNFDNLFYYIKEILKNTGLDFDIRIANNIRSSTGGTDDTLFHDISVYEFGLLKDNFQKFTAKELLSHILKTTNSRIFQSNGSWYIISNSNIIDKRLLIAADPPSVEFLRVATIANTAVTTQFIGVDPQGLSLSFSLVTTPNQGTVSGLSGADFTYTPTTDFVGDDLFTYKANNGSQDSDNALVSITVAPAAGTLTNGTFTGRLYRGKTLFEAISNAIGNVRGSVSQTVRYVNRLDDERTTLSQTRFFEVGHFFVSGQNLTTPLTSLDGYLARASMSQMQKIVEDKTGVPFTGEDQFAIAVRVANGIIVERYTFKKNFSGEFDQP